MKKMDLHIHTVSTKRDKPFAFSIEKLKGYVIQEKVDLIAITNHNLFDKINSLHAVVFFLSPLYVHSIRLSIHVATLMPQNHI